TIPVATVVGGTPKLFTIPLIATGNEATLKDMIIWPSAIAIIGAQEVRSAAIGLVLTVDCMAIVSSRRSYQEQAFVLVFQLSGWGPKRSIPRRCDRNLATSCPLTLFPAPSSGGAKVPNPPFPGETVTMPPPMPLLPGRPMSKSQSPDVS